MVEGGAGMAVPGVRVLLRHDHGIAELEKLCLTNDAGIAKPAPVGLHSRHGSACHVLLEGGRLEDLALAVAHRVPAAFVHLQPLDCRAGPHVGLAATRLAGSVWVVAAMAETQFER